MAAARTPTGLDTKGRKLWRDLTAAASFNPAELVLLEEACRIADRLDRLDALIRGEDDAWMRFRPMNEDGTEITVTIDSALTEARQQANVMKQIIAALRVPESDSGTGTVKRPQARPQRGAYAPTGKVASNVTAIERAAARRAARTA